MKLKDLQIGNQAKVIGYEKNDRVYRDKLLSMGLTRGVIIKVVKKAPLGDPIDIEVRGFNLSLRKDEANILILEEVNND